MPVVLQDGFDPATPLTHARIGWATIATLDNVTASSAAADFPADAAVNPMTWDRWLPTGLPATWEIDASAAVSVDYVGIAGHTLSDGLLSVAVERSDDGVVWTEVVATTPSDNSAILFLFAAVSARYWRLNIDGGSPQYIGVVYLGSVLEMARPIYGGVSPLALSRSTVIKPQLSEMGQFLGRSVVRGGRRTAFAWRNLKADWYRSTFDPFVAGAILAPFFLAWRPGTFLEDVGYVWTDRDIVPTNAGGRDRMEVGFEVQGLEEDPAGAFVFDLDQSYLATNLDEVDMAAFDLARFCVVVSWTATGSEAESTRVVEWNDGTADNQVNVSRNGANVALNVVVAGGFVASISLGAWAAGDHVAAIRIAEDDFAGSLDGAAAVVDAAGAVPVVDAMLIAHSLGPTLELGAGEVGVRLTQGVLDDATLESYSGA